ncbi:metallophosphoesterase [Ruegeria sp. 2012CJ41-6]|uniref:Metallophosphoesterase n=1 Tax=Ruegeria spongiae TaxID=2942209 RepID=A0ABT0Q709_9RHOB|nr:metallophosphoesterase [Ruegeria spongiae]MCL6285661.1 metallophosphoesterase [Ruegeria spongiae]
MTDIFVIMPFGEKSIISDDRIVTLDFDLVYRNLISQACSHANKSFSRIDEIQGSSSISNDIIQKLFSAEIVIADVTGANANVFYELGIRQSLTERPSILISSDRKYVPFDIHDQQILFYDTDELDASVAGLSEIILATAGRASSSPILRTLREFGLQASPENRTDFEVDFRQKIDRAETVEQLTAVWQWCSDKRPLPTNMLSKLAKKSARTKAFGLSVQIARRAAVEKPNDYEIHRDLGWYLRNQGEDYFSEAEAELLRALELNPADPEALGILGGLYKRKGRFSDAARCYNQGYQLAPTSLYMRVTRAASIMLDELARKVDTTKGYAAYLELFEDLQPGWRDRRDPWEMSVLGESAFVLGKQQDALVFFSEADETSHDPTVLNSPLEQISLFGSLGYQPTEGAKLIEAATNTSKKLDRIPVSQSVSSDERPVRILHLSDIHFGEKCLPGGDVKNMHRFGQGDYSRPLVEHFRDEFLRRKSHFSERASGLFVVASGDFAYTATNDEFQAALEFFEDLHVMLEVPKNRFIFCPGNHDINWEDSKISRDRRFDNYLIFLKKFYGSDLLKKMYPMLNWEFTIDTPRPSAQEIVSASYFTDQNVLFCSFNSCVYENEQHHYGYISQDQQRNALELIDELEVPDNAVRVAVVHHHVHPFPEALTATEKDGHWVDLSTIRDGGLFEKFLERNQFDFVLHGHKHQPQIRETTVRDRTSSGSLKSLIVCGAGSCGVASSELPHSMGSHFEFVEVFGRPRTIGAEFARIEWRELPYDPAAEWTTSNIWTVLG